MTVLAIDPGPANSAWVIWDGTNILGQGLELNEGVLHRLGDIWFDVKGRPDVLAIERVASYGMPVGAEVFETVFWSGRFAQVWIPGEVVRVPRKEVVLHHNGSNRGNDATIRQAMFDRFGPKGTKSKPGLLYGTVKDIMQAFALAVCVYDRSVVKARYVAGFSELIPHLVRAGKRQMMPSDAK